jgi:lambda family phage portal protein
VLGWTPEQAREWKRNVQAEFSLWADSTECDQAATQNFYELQYMLLGCVLESGDAFTLLPSAAPTSSQPHTLRVQIVEADRIGNPLGRADTPTEAGGIRFADGKPVAAHIYNQHPGSGLVGTASAGEWTTFTGRSGRRRLLHHLRKHRPDQPRGVPYITPIVDLIKQLGDYADAEVKAAVVSAYFTVFLTRKEGESGGLLDAGDPIPGSSPAPDAPVAMGPAAVVELNPGEDATLANPSRPNPNFEGFVAAVMRQIGMALGIPSELLMKQFNASYSASKAALLDAWVYFRSVRTWLARSFCQPVYETWLAEAVAAGRISAPGFFTDPLRRWAYCQASWPGDSMGSINPKDEVAAYTSAIDARLISRERAEWELFGSDWGDTFGQKLAENELLKANDMLPVPKAGAAAPTGQNGAGNPPKQATP